MYFGCMETKKQNNRCSWCGSNILYVDYHDKEWGVPVYDDKTLFEFLILETFQAGLSWITVLRKRENFRKAFDQFDYHKIANYGIVDKKEAKNLCILYICWSNLKSKALNKKNVFIATASS